MKIVGAIVIGVLVGILFYMLQRHKKDITILKGEYEGRLEELNRQLAAKEEQVKALAAGQSCETTKDKAYDVLCNSYTKILKINLTKDTFEIIHSLDEELDASKGYSDSITVWLRDFARAGMVHKDDVTDYLKETDGDYLKKYFKRGLNSKTVHYRRKFGDKYKKVKMEIIPAEDYKETMQNVYLYVKDIE